MATNIEENIGFVETMIGCCGTADETAEIASRLQRQINYLKDTHVNIDLLVEAYEKLKLDIMLRAGISDEFEQYIDKALENYV